MNTLVAYISKIIEKEIHNVLDEKKKAMVASRMTRRLIELGDISVEQYFDYFKKNRNKEVNELISLLTTHHTFFFREFLHFEFLIKNMGELVHAVKARGGNKIRILSSACSRGQEVYSLAMFMNYHLLGSYPEMDFEIVGIDIDPLSIKHAKNGVYNISEVKSVPMVYASNNWQQGSGKIKDFIKIKDNIQIKTKFISANLLNVKSTLGLEKFDVIFCRNVYIYFSEEVIKKSANYLLDILHDKGYFFTGVCESLAPYNLPLESLGVSIYSKTEAPSTIHKTPTVATSAKKISQSFIKLPYPLPIKILIVDDSIAIRKILSKIFDSDKDFSIVGTAKDGIAAAEFVKKNKVDAMTLDIHMPKMDGVEYLEKHFNSTHPKVVVVSSASREDARYAQKTLDLGASDFVEKPEMNNLEQRGEEIKSKIKMTFLENNFKGQNYIDSSTKKDFVIVNPESKARVLILPYSQIGKSIDIINSLQGVQSPVYLIFEGNNAQLDMIKEKVSEKLSFRVETGVVSSPSANSVYICSESNVDELVLKYKDASVVCGVLGECTKSIAEKILDFKNLHLLLEETPMGHKHLSDACTDMFPATSFGHIGTEYLSKD